MHDESPQEPTAETTDQHAAPHDEEPTATQEPTVGTVPASDTGDTDHDTTGDTTKMAAGVTAVSNDDTEVDAADAQIAELEESITLVDAAMSHLDAEDLEAAEAAVGQLDQGNDPTLFAAPSASS